MKLPRDIGGAELASRLRHYGYETTRQTGSHLRLTTSIKGHEHHITDPHAQGTENWNTECDLAAYLEIDRNKLVETLFGS